MPNARDLSNRAIEIGESGQCDEVLALVNKGIILFKICKYLDALNAFAQAADIDPEFTEAWYNKWMALMYSGKCLEAIRAFNKVLNIHPHDERACEQLDRAQRMIMESGSFSLSSNIDASKLTT